VFRILQRFQTVFLTLVLVAFADCRQERLIICECPPSARPNDSRCPACKASSCAVPLKSMSTRVLFVSTEIEFNDDISTIQSSLSRRISECAEMRNLINTNASKENIEKSIEWLSCGDSPDNTEDGLSVLYISSHGYAKDGISYLKPHGLDEEQAQNVDKLLNKDDIFIKPLLRMDKLCPNRKYLVIIDSCYSGGMLSWLPPSNVCDGSDENAHLYSRLRVITSSRADQMSSAQDLENSLFTKTLASALNRIPQDSTTEDVWISVRSILHEDLDWKGLRQEPAIFTCPQSRLTPFLSSLPRNKIESSVQPRIAAFRKWINNNNIMLESDYCAKIGTGSRLVARTEDANIFLSDKPADSQLSNGCVVSVKRIETRFQAMERILDEKHVNHQTRNKYYPGDLFYITGEKSLSQSVIVELPANKEKMAADLYEGIQSARELTLLSNKNLQIAKAQGYYRLIRDKSANRPDGVGDAWWLRENPTPNTSGLCQSLLPDRTPIRIDNQLGQVNLLRDAVKLHQIKFWESVKSPEVSRYFSAQLAIFKQTENKLMGAAMDSPNCIEAGPGRYSLRLVGYGNPPEAQQRRFVYLCMLDGHNKNRPPNEAFPAAQMLFPRNQRQENQTMPSRSEVQDQVMLADLELQSGDSKLFTLITSVSPRSVDLCSQGPILYTDRTKSIEYDLTLSGDRQEYRRFVETDLASPIRHGSTYRQPGLIELRSPVTGLRASPQLAGDEEETLQRLWIRVP